MFSYLCYQSTFLQSFQLSSLYLKEETLINVEFQKNTISRIHTLLSSVVINIVYKMKSVTKQDVLRVLPAHASVHVRVCVRVCVRMCVCMCVCSREKNKSTTYHRLKKTSTTSLLKLSCRHHSRKSSCHC